MKWTVRKVIAILLTVAMIQGTGSAFSFALDAPAKEPAAPAVQSEEPVEEAGDSEITDSEQDLVEAEEPATKQADSEKATKKKTEGEQAVSENAASKMKRKAPSILKAAGDTTGIPISVAAWENGKPSKILPETVTLKLLDTQGKQASNVSLNGNYAFLMTIHAGDQDFYKIGNIDAWSTGQSGTCTFNLGQDFKQFENASGQNFDNANPQTEGMTLEVSLITASENPQNFKYPRDKEKMTVLQPGEKIGDYVIGQPAVDGNSVVINAKEAEPYKAVISVEGESSGTANLGGSYYLVGKFSKTQNNNKSNFYFVSDSAITPKNGESVVMVPFTEAYNQNSKASVPSGDDLEVYLVKGNKPEKSALEQGTVDLVEPGTVVNGYAFDVTAGDEQAQLTFTKLEAKDYTVEINTYNMQGQAAPLEAAAKAKSYYLLARIMDGKKTIGWQIKPVTFGDDSTQTVTFNANDFTKQGSDSEKVSYYPAKQTMSVRLYNTDGTAVTSYDQIVKDGGSQIHDSIDNYVFKPAPEVKQNENKTILHLRHDYNKQHDVVVEFPEDSRTIADNEYYYVFVKSEHASTGTTYFMQRLSNDGSKEEIKISNLGPGTNWTKADGTVRVDEPFTGNENVTVRVLKATSDLSLEDAIKESNCEIVSGTKTRTEDTDVSKLLTTVTDTIVFHKEIPEATNDYTFKSILGNAVNYGVVADTYRQTDHAQTNFAVNNYSGNNNFQPDLANRPGKVLIGNLDSKLQLGNKGRKDFGSVEIQVGNDNGNTFQDDSQSANLKKVDESDINNAVNAMIDYGRAKSAELAAKPCNYYPPLPDSNGNVVLDTTKYPDNATIYVDADRIKSAIAKTDGMTINKKDGQTIVFNFSTSGPVTVGKFQATLEGATYNTESPVDPGAKNEALDKIARRIIWNIPNSTDVTMAITTGVFLVPDSNATVKVNGTSSGWVLTGGTFTQTSGEFHNVYQDMPDNPDINTDAGVIEIKKTFSGDADKLTEAQKNKIKFTVTGPNDYKRTFTYSEMTNGVKSLPVAVGTGYTVTESNAAVSGLDVTTTYKVGEADATETAPDNISVAKSGKSAVEVTNKYSSEATTGDLVIKKTVDGENLTESEFNGALKFTVQNAAGKYLDKDGNLSDEAVELTLKDSGFVKGADGTYTKTFKDVAPGKYTVTETNSDVKGYVLKDSSVTSGEGTVENGKTATVELKDEYEKAAEKGDLVIKKTVDGENLTESEFNGALKFTVQNAAGKYLDKDGNLSDEAVELTLKDSGFVKGADGTYTKTFKDVAPGKYTVTETNSDVKGYVLKDSSVTSGEGTVENGKTATVELKDEYEEESDIDFFVNKVEINAGPEVEGAELSLFEEGSEEALDSWTSKKGEVHNFGVKMEAGKTYILRETDAPAGYGRITTDIMITVDQDENVTAQLGESEDKDGNTIYLVEDKPIKATLELVDNKEKPLKEGTLKLVDKDGNTVTSWVSDGGIYDIGKYLKAGETYTIQEDVTPNGYKRSEDITVTVGEDGTVENDGKVVVENVPETSGQGSETEEPTSDNPTQATTDKPTKTTDTTTSTTHKATTAKPAKDGSAGTGDDTPIMAFILLLLASLAGIGGITAINIRRRQAR